MMTEKIMRGIVKLSCRTEMIHELVSNPRFKVICGVIELTAL
jgi:hypothetical protein